MFCAVIQDTGEVLTVFIEYYIICYTILRLFKEKSEPSHTGEKISKRLLRLLFCLYLVGKVFIDRQPPLKCGRPFHLTSPPQHPGSTASSRCDARFSLGALNWRAVKCSTASKGLTRPTRERETLQYPVTL